MFLILTHKRHVLQQVRNVCYLFYLAVTHYLLQTRVMFLILTHKRHVLQQVRIYLLLILINYKSLLITDVSDVLSIPVVPTGENNCYQFKYALIYSIPIFV
jgi:hypothetical protein